MLTDQNGQSKLLLFLKKLSILLVWNETKCRNDVQKGTSQIRPLVFILKISSLRMESCVVATGSNVRLHYQRFAVLPLLLRRLFKPLPSVSSWWLVTIHFTPTKALTTQTVKFKSFGLVRTLSVGFKSTYPAENASGVNSNALDNGRFAVCTNPLSTIKIASSLSLMTMEISRTVHL